nr:class D sortase [uncultured Schaedlerella sp.]
MSGSLKQIHKKALLTAALLSAALAGTLLALSPLWVRHREMCKQEAMLTRIQKEAGEAQEKEAPMSDEPVIEPPVLMAASEASQEAETITAENPPPGSEIEAVCRRIQKPQEGTEIGILSIPKIDATLPVTAGVSEEQLKVSEGWVRQTDRIGIEGNAVIAGHRSYTFGQHFNRLEELEAGDPIVFTTSDGETIPFSVSEILTVEPDDPAVFALPLGGGAQLTLYTCTPAKVATHRLIVRALRVEE